MIDSVVKKSEYKIVYPHMAVDDYGSVILFTSPNRGVVVGSEDIGRIIGYAGEYSEDLHRPFYGSVTLRSR